MAETGPERPRVKSTHGPQWTAPPLREQLKPIVPLRFPGFEEHYRLVTINAYAFRKADCRDWYREFADRVISAIEDRQYLPVYRMGDGEYRFALGADFRQGPPLWRMPPRQLLRELLLPLVRGRGYHKSGSAEYGFEEYTLKERSHLYSTFVESIRTVADNGILALGLHDKPIYEAFIPEIFDWFDSNEVKVNCENYHHVYSVYALIHGPDRRTLFEGRKVLVVTGLTEQKREGIETGLRRMNVADVQFLPISSKKALTEVLDLGGVDKDVDVALVGAGVGSASVLAQLEPLSTACLDVGFGLSTLADPDLRWNRPFCIPDDEFDVSRVRFLSRG